MKIIFLGEAASIHTIRWVNSLSEKGIEVILVSLKGKLDTIGKISDNVKVIYLPFGTKLGYYLNMFALKKIISKEEPDLINAHYASGYGTLGRLSGFNKKLLNVWGSDVPYLKGVKDFSTGTSTSNWTVTTSRQALESKLNAASKGVGKLKSIQLTPLGKPGQQTSDRGVSGRIKSATFIGTSGKTTVDGDALRSILGLKSTLFDFYVNHNPAKGTGKAYHSFTGKNDTVYIKGHGWGHGLGMSQWGAAEMAKRANPGDTNYYQTILRHYYSGITLKKMY